MQLFMKEVNNSINLCGETDENQKPGHLQPRPAASQRPKAPSHHTRDQYARGHPQITTSVRRLTLHTPQHFTIWSSGLIEPDRSPTRPAEEVEVGGAGGLGSNHQLQVCTYKFKANGFQYRHSTGVPCHAPTLRGMTRTRTNLLSPEIMNY